MSHHFVSISSRTARMLKDAGFCSPQGLARVRASTVLRRVPTMTAKGFCDLHTDLRVCGLSFRRDPRSTEPILVGYQNLCALWKRGFVYYDQLPHATFEKLEDACCEARSPRTLALELHSHLKELGFDVPETPVEKDARERGDRKRKWIHESGCSEAFAELVSQFPEISSVPDLSGYVFPRGLDTERKYHLWRRGLYDAP